MISRLSSIKRVLKIIFEEERAVILFGPRKTGKTTFLKSSFPSATYLDLLKSEVRAQFQIRPSLLREIALANETKTYILDEIQKVPQLLDEVHWLLENSRARFILCGSSPRKLKRGAANLLGGRAIKYDLFPLVLHEIKEIDLNRAVNHGLIPQHYLSRSPQKFLKSYIELYLQEEIIEESKIRNLKAFHRFMEVSALMNGELLNYANVGADCGISGKTVRDYYQILEDTLLGFTLEPWAKVKTRKLIETAKFYLFDVGVARYLKGIDRVEAKTVEFGNLFETILINEVRAYISYRQSSMKMSFWRTTSNLEVDLILGNMKLAIEFKATSNIRGNDLKNLKVLLEEFPHAQCFLVCLESEVRKLNNGITLLPVQNFIQLLWADKLI